MKYIGEECFRCGEKFKDGDDVVVCPDCGTPYHKSCYIKSGECINHQLHENGESWKPSMNADPPSPEIQDKNSLVICPRCRHLNNRSENNCINCGEPLNNADESYNIPGFDTIDPTQSYLGFNPDEAFTENADMKDLFDFVDVNTLYYIPLFKRMKDTGKKISFNLTCLLFPYFYFANRKMWLWAIVTAVISILLNIPFLLYTISQQATDIPFMQEIINAIYSSRNLLNSLIEICNAADWLMRVLLCLFANWLYYCFSVNSICKIKRNRGGCASSEQLKVKGGIKPINILLIVLIILGVSFILYFSVMFILLYMQQIGIF